MVGRITRIINILARLGISLFLTRYNNLFTDLLNSSNYTLLWPNLDKRAFAPLPKKDRLFAEIAKRRHPEKNAAIMLISFHVRFRAHEISLLLYQVSCQLIHPPSSQIASPLPSTGTPVIAHLFTNFASLQ